MKRFSIAMAAASCLALSYQVYAQWFDSMTALEESAQQVEVPAEPAERPVQSADILAIAGRYLADEEWAQQANYTFERSNNVYVYTEKYDLLEDTAEDESNRVRFAPFAMVVLDADNPSAAPYVIRCESASISFENPFRLEFGAPKPGRFVSGTLDGAVAITGPDGLQVFGQNFVFSEKEAHLYSDYPVEFAYGPHEGSGGRQSGTANGIELKLIASHAEGLLGRDGPRIDGIATIALRRDVRLDLEYEQDDELMKATVSSRGIFEYVVANRIATFEDDVIVERTTSEPGEPFQADRLQCDWLALQFEEETDELTGIVLADESALESDTSIHTVSDNSDDDDRPAHPFANLRFLQLRAHGDRAVLRSDENRMLGRMHELRYDAANRRIILLDDEAVRVQYDSTELVSRDVEVLHGEGGEILSLECRGAGQMEQLPKIDGPPQFRAFWDDHLSYGADTESDLWLIRMDGRARVVQAGQVGIQADHLALWIDPESVQDIASQGNRVGSGPLPLKFAQADGHVLMVSSEFRIETEQLRASFSPADLPDDRDTTESASDVPGADPDSEEAWTLRAHDVQVQVLHDHVTENSDVSEATAAGQVQISRHPADGTPLSDERPLSISGDELHLQNSGGTGQLLTLIGEPAHIRQGDLHLEARDIVFDRQQNTARVEGRGMLRFPVAVNLSGEPVQTPVPLDVHWQEQMTFDGRQAQFFGNVVLKLNDGRVNESRLYCEDLNVVLSEYLSFTEERPESEELQFTSVTCRDGVRTELYEWEGTRLTGIRVFELAEFTLEHDTGILHGLGPGVISRWTRGTGRRISIAPDATAEANQPADSDQQEWEYTQVHFSRNMTGNAQQSTVELHGRVRAIYAPVQHPREVFTRDELSGDSPNAEHAVWLGCDDLAVGLHPWGAVRPDDDYAVFGATGHCELEGQLFRAVADLISFDESKRMFTLKGLGDRKASIYYQRNPGEQPARLSAQRMEFTPSEHRISLEGASGFQASP